MEKTTRKTTPLISACEEYVVEELKQAKEDNKELERNLEETKKEIGELYDRHNLLLDLIIGAFQSDDTYVEESSSGIASVYVLGHYIGLFDINDTSRENQKLIFLANLINKAKRMPKRD